VVPGEDGDDEKPEAQPPNNAKPTPPWRKGDVAAAGDFSEEMAVIRRILATSAYVLEFPGVQVVRCRADKALPTTWVRYSLGTSIEPRIQEHAKWAKVADGTDDDRQTWQPFTKPKTTYPGTDGFAAQSILGSRCFNVGKTVTSGLAGVWHARLETARRYGIPSVWACCSQPCLVVFELRVTRQTRLRKVGYCTQAGRWPGCFEVTAILLARFTGDLKKSFGAGYCVPKPT
jgi:hypothetical protein